MKETTHVDRISTEDLDSLRVRAALKQFLADLKISSYELEKLTGYSNTKIRRMFNEQEPRPSQIAHIERCLESRGVVLGTVLRMAKLVTVDNVRELLAADEDLLPVFRRSGVEDYNTWVRISAEGRR